MVQMHSGLTLRDRGRSKDLHVHFPFFYLISPNTQGAHACVPRAHCNFQTQGFSFRRLFPFRIRKWRSYFSRNRKFNKFVIFTKFKSEGDKQGTVSYQIHSRVAILSWGKGKGTSLWHVNIVVWGGSVIC